MKLLPWIACLLPLLLVARAEAQSVLGAGARYHTRHSQYEALPFNKGDLSYVAAYEYHDAGGYWQLAVGFAPSIREGSDGRGAGVDSVTTPQLNLFFEDRNWVAGVGILGSYVRTDSGNEWTDMYWQTMIGYQINLPVFKLEAMVYYPFHKWKTFRDFKTQDLEFGLMMKRSF